MKPPERRKSTVGWAVWREREREREMGGQKMQIVLQLVNEVASLPHILTSWTVDTGPAISRDSSG